MTDLRKAQGHVKNPGHPIIDMLGEDAVAKVLMALICRLSPKDNSVHITEDDIQRLQQSVLIEGKGNIVFLSHPTTLELKLVDDESAKVAAAHEKERLSKPTQ